MSSLLSFLIILTIINCGFSLKLLDNKKYFQLKELYTTNKFTNKYFNGTWISGSEFIYFKSNEGGVFLYNLRNQKSTLFLHEDVVKKLNSHDLTISPDRKFLLVRTDRIRNHLKEFSWRHAFYDIENGILTQLADNQRIGVCQFLRNHSLIYNFENNVYYIEDVTNNIEPLALTTDGVPGLIYNGMPDYTYKDKFYRIKQTVTWISKNGNWLAIAAFNDSHLDNVTFYTYGQPNNINDQYPTRRHIRYSEPGKLQPSVSVKFLNLADASKLEWVTLKPPVELASKDHLLAAGTWASAHELALIWMNRVQNKSILVICDVNTAKCENEVFRHERHGWIDVNTPIFSRTKSKNFICIVPILQNDTSKGEFLHLAKYTRGKKTPEVMTSGLRTVIAIEGWNDKTDLIYYTGTLEDAPWQKHLFVAGSRDECISCDMTTPYGDLCNYVAVTFSPGDKYFSLTCDSQAPPYTFIYNAKTIKPVILWQDNAVQRKSIDEYHLPQIKYLQVPLPGSDVFFKIFFPPQFDPADTNVTYPMVVHIYAASEAIVTERQELNYEIFWSTKRNYIYARIEGRGSEFKGSKIYYGSYRNFGTVEIDDFINGTSYLLDNYPWIDKNNVGLWGWSYGGYAVLQGFVRDYYNIYKCGVSIAPLIDLQEFISMHIEAYMSMPTPEDNLKGYEEANLLNHALKLRVKKFAILHGTADENAHFAKTLRFFHALQKAGVDFEQVIYPDEPHSLLGSLPHVYHFLDDFWIRCFSS